MKVTRKQHFLHAALFWTAIGFALGFFGFKWVWLGFDLQWAVGWLSVCTLLGLVKGEFAIGKAARKSIARIQGLPETSPFYRVFTRGQWMVVFGMMFLGMVIRHLHIEKAYRGLVLATVGVALLWASRYFWKMACCRNR
ncbi:MAG: hypothetical protein HY609_00535 [Deltaproteobacteria bacterium]|nr:hypothetical protein [Deltaproteobacteria bacterium]MBI4223394.1 hypothetical protein [Deltaproteobacteria bacterium]